MKEFKIDSLAYPPWQFSTIAKNSERHARLPIVTDSKRAIDLILKETEAEMRFTNLVGALGALFVAIVLNGHSFRTRAGMGPVVAH